MNFEKTYLGIELGSTRIKACLIDESFSPVAGGGFSWENSFENGYWTYSQDEIHNGVKECFSSLRDDVKEKFGEDIETLGAIGISGMMHGFLAFDKDGKLLTPFRTWRNTTTEKASSELTKLFGFNIPQRWSIAHLYQAILNNEPYIKNIAHITTLAGYIHYLLTGKYEVGIGEASGIFPVGEKDYDKEMLEKFNNLLAPYDFNWSIFDILPEVKMAGEKGAYLTAEGASFLDVSGKLKEKIPVCPPEGDAGTGMVATNSVRANTGNISAGTSVFSMLVLEKPLKGVYPEIDVVSTPDGFPVAMVHSNNGCSELDRWINIFGEFAELSGKTIEKSALYELLYKKALSSDADCGGVVSYNFLADEPVAGVESGKPMIFIAQQKGMNIAEFFRSQIYASFAVLKIGMNLLTENEGISATNFNAHGGLFKVKGVAQKFLADALSTPITVSETAGEGGAWGMALLSAYMKLGENMNIADWLDEKVFKNANPETITPETDGVEGFARFFNRYINGIAALNALKEI